MKQWRCKICGYIHVGEQPPAKCPVCGAGPEFFEEINPTSGTEQVDREQIQKVLFALPAGLFMVSSRGDFPDLPKQNGMINNTVFQITDQPLQVVLGMNKGHLTTEYIKESGVFAVNFLTSTQLPLVKIFGHQSGRQTDKFVGLPWHSGLTGAAILDTAPGFLECRTDDGHTVDAGTHWLFLGRVVAGSLVSEEPLLTYQQYRNRRSEFGR